MYIMEEEKNQEYKHFTEELPEDYIDAYIFVSNFVQYGMVLYNYHYELVEIAYHYQIGIPYRRLYNHNNDEEKIEEEEQIYFLVQELKNYLEEEERTSDLEYIQELEEEGNLWI